MLKKVSLYAFSKGKQCFVKDENGKRLNCTNEDIFDTLVANEGNTVELEFDDAGNIIGINLPEDNTPENNAPEEPADVPAEPAKNAPAKKAAAKPAEKPAEPAPAETPAEPGIESFDPASVNTSTEGAEDAPVSNAFPLLNANEIEVRVSQIFDWGVQLLLYKNARCDQERMDAKFGPMGWQKSYQSIDAKLFCIVSVRDPETGEWIAKSDVGVESNTEAEKGQASDAFKRACVVWGSGRELYSAPNITVPANKTVIEKNKNGKLICKDKFAVQSIGYDKDRRICSLEIVSASAKDVVYRFRK